MRRSIMRHTYSVKYRGTYRDTVLPYHDIPRWSHLDPHPRCYPIKRSLVFRSHYKLFSNDRGTLGDGVFVGVHEDFIAEQKIN
ncbi:hypothetical protein DPMN_081975 [Dreissena polymorpha]|uniref:Uncharacterized protein n=1 Tax=Dreissena polymorpha TaxID=45954 RepID=A0A9D3Y6U8_DREPO|nr:hypothetical protein DPMN_081975 [Dreissena polymorpha]